MIIFYHEGIKTSDRKGLQKVIYKFNKKSNGNIYITIFNKSFSTGFSPVITSRFKVYINNELTSPYYGYKFINIEKGERYFDEIIDCHLFFLQKNKKLSNKVKKNKIRELFKWLEK